MLTRLLHIILFVMSVSLTKAQYYIRGEVKNEKNVPLQNVKIVLHSNHLLYYSGNSGAFGITTRTLSDSLSFALEGYESKTIKINADQWQDVSLKTLASKVYLYLPNFFSVTINFNQTSNYHCNLNDVTYFQLV